MIRKEKRQNINNHVQNNSQILSEAEEIELYSEEVQEIMGKPPHWVIKWGITVIFLVVSLIFFGSFIIKYPDVINASVLILSENPPVIIYAHSTGKIDQLLVQNEQEVESGDYLAIIENTANYQHVSELSTLLEQFEARFATQDFSELIQLPDYYILGSIQASFSGFQRHYNEFRNYVELDIIEKKISSISKQIKDYEKYSEKLNNQASNQQAIVKLSNDQYHRDSLLYSEGVIALSQLEKTEQAYIQTKSSYQNLLASLSSTQMTVNQLKFDIIDLQGQRLDKTGTMVNIMKEAYENLQANISDWEKQYVLASPIAGKVTFTNIWSKNQFVTTNDQVFSVIPVKPQEIIGRMRFSTTGSGKVETGQQVLIQLENFPFNEFGMLEGTITSISLIPQTTQDGTFYTSQLSLNHGLTTNYGTPLVFNQEMHGQAQIITNRISVFERFISPLKYVFKKSI